MRALIAMSGGVDSSVAARLMQDAGYECVGCTMQLFDTAPADAEDNAKAGDAACPADPVDDAKAGDAACPTDPDGNAGVRDAAAVAAQLGMEFHAIDLRDAFRRCVMEPFAAAYAGGMTPNPCIDCNRYLKFGQLLQEADKLDCEYIVTGHYARVVFDEAAGMYQLRKGLDASKDQSYMLCHLTPQQLARVRLPLGELHKSEVRRIAAEAGLICADRPDSQDICFVPDGNYAGAVERLSGRSFPPGEFVDLEGNPMGTHKGIIHYTIGQHKRLGQAFGRPRYVCRIDAKTNRIWLGGPEDVFTSFAAADEFSWCAGKAPGDEIRCRVRTRYRQKEQWATVRPVGEEAVEIYFDEPQRAITPGQTAVLYDEDMVLGGGTIRRG